MKWVDCIPKHIYTIRYLGGSLFPHCQQRPDVCSRTITGCRLCFCYNFGIKCYKTMEEKKPISPSQVPDGNKQLPAQYIRQPYPISAIQANLSTQQIRILVAMMQSVQDGVQKMFERGSRNSQLNLFSDMQDDYVNIDFKFSDVASHAYAYADVEKVADKFMQMVFRYEDKQKGEISLSHFVYKVIYPSRGSKRDKIRFKFTKEQALVVFNFTMYSRYLMPVVMSSKSKHTARIYMLITSARGFEKNGICHWYVGYDEIRRILGCDEKDEHGRWHRKRSKDYKHFKFDVLRVAESELKKLFDEGKSDCWFEFSEVPEKYDGEPKRLDFIVHMATDDQKQQPQVTVPEW